MASTRRDKRTSSPPSAGPDDAAWVKLPLTPEQTRVAREYADGIGRLLDLGQSLLAGIVDMAGRIDRDAKKLGRGKRRR